MGGQAMKLSKQFDGDLKIADGERAVVATISTNAVDRDGDVLIPTGLEMSEFKQNPVVLFGHDSTRAPVGKAIAIQRTRRGIIAKMQFAKRPEFHPPAAEWFADTLFSLFQQNILRAFSVGFTVPQNGMRDATDKDKGRFGNEVRRVITKWKLLEFSIVPVPSNQDALALAVSKGLVPRGCWVADELGVDAIEEVVAESKAESAAEECLILYEMAFPRLEPFRAILS
jgi:phage head maturation protease